VWIFKIKRNGIFRARLVACGYSQVPGIDFQESLAPVMNDVTLRMLFIIILVWNLKGKIVDVETAFLHGELKEKIFLHLPDGLEGDKQAECLFLRKTTYGLRTDNVKTE
jgi:Reverse transcriptase (RNA-dependent DNA polymerase)